MFSINSIIESLKNIMSSTKTTKPSKITKVSTPSLQEVVEEASKWIGLDETSPGIDTFRRAVNNEANGESWCAAFVMYCTRAVALRHNREPSLYPSELCYDLWMKSPKECRLDIPVVGCIVVWNYPGTIKGHTGIVTSVMSGGYITTIEGNTSNDGSNKGPHGVFRRTRSLSGGLQMKVLGFLNPFA